MGPPSTSGQPPKRLKTDKVAKQQQQQQQQAEFDPSVVSEGGAAAAAAMTSLSGMRLLCCGGLVATVQPSLPAPHWSRPAMAVCSPSRCAPGSPGPTRRRRCRSSQRSRRNTWRRCARCRRCRPLPLLSLSLSLSVQCRLRVCTLHLNLHSKHTITRVLLPPSAPVCPRLMSRAAVQGREGGAGWRLRCGRSRGRRDEHVPRQSAARLPGWVRWCVVVRRSAVQCGAVSPPTMPLSSKLTFCTLPLPLLLLLLPAGRSWLEAPRDATQRQVDQCFLPKRHVHTWSGHSKGVNAIRCASGPTPLPLAGVGVQPGRSNCSIRRELGPAFSAHQLASPCRLRLQLLPHHRAPAAVCGAGWTDQDVGRGGRQEVHAHLHGAHQGGRARGWRGVRGGGPAL